MATLPLTLPLSRPVALPLVLLLLHLSNPTAHQVGFNYALALQVNRLDTNKAAGYLSAAFPQVTKAKLFNHDLKDVDALLAVGIKDVTLAIPNYELTKVDAAWAADM